MEHATDWGNVGWAIGWCVAVGTLFRLGLALPLAARGAAWRRRAWHAATAAAGVGLAVLAVAALSLHDTHFDLTRERAHTPSPQALAVAEGLREPVAITYFLQGQDPNAHRARAMLELMADRNPLLTVTAIDPDKQPSLAATAGVRIYNAALIEGGGRRLVVQGTDETEFAIGIQRVLRERRVTLCFVEGHNEYDPYNEEYHTHLDAAVGHSHDDAAALVVETTGHGVGRWRRSLEGLGYDVERLPLATLPAVPGHCSVLIDAGPRTTWLPAESAALRAYLADGGAALLLHDLGYALEPTLARLVEALGARPAPAVIVDPVSHYGTDQEMVAVTGYEPHPITAKVAYTFFPGARPLTPVTPVDGVEASAVVVSAPTSTLRPVPTLAERAVGPAAPAPSASAGPQVIAMASEGRLAAAGRPFRAVLVGDADFLSNSFYPYMSNSDLALSLVRWLAREEALAPVTPRVPVPPLVLLTEPQLRGLYLLVVGLLPLLAVAAGALAWWRRR